MLAKDARLYYTHVVDGDGGRRAWGPSRAIERRPLVAALFCPPVRWWLESSDNGRTKGVGHCHSTQSPQSPLLQ